jgi:hypothetical protein
MQRPLKRDTDDDREGAERSAVQEAHRDHNGTESMSEDRARASSSKRTSPALVVEKDQACALVVEKGPSLSRPHEKVWMFQRADGTGSRTSLAMSMKIAAPKLVVEKGPLVTAPHEKVWMRSSQRESGW